MNHPTLQGSTRGRWRLPRQESYPQGSSQSQTTSLWPKEETGLIHMPNITLIRCQVSNGTAGKKCNETLNPDHGTTLLLAPLGLSNITITKLYKGGISVSIPISQVRKQRLRAACSVAGLKAGASGFGARRLPPACASQANCYKPPGPIQRVCRPHHRQLDAAPAGDRPSGTP